jgi:hypothetical protein
LVRESRLHKARSTELPKTGDRQLVLEDIINKITPDWKKGGNLTIEPWLDVHDAILRSNVVCGFQSTTLFEAGLARKPVVIPYFSEFSRTTDGAKYPFREFLDAFDVADNKKAFKELIRHRLADSNIDPIAQERRNHYFSTYVSDLDGQSLLKTEKLIVNLLENGRAS